MCSCNAGYTADATGLNCVASNNGLTQEQAASIANMDMPRRDLDGFRLWLAAIIIESVGGAMLVSGAILAALGVDDDSLLWPGIGLVISGGGMLLSGLAMALIGAARMRRDRARRLVAPGASRFTPLIAASPEGALSFGMLGSF